MNTKRIIIIGSPDISSIALARLMEKYESADMLAFQTIGKIDEPMKTNHSFEGELSKESYERLQELLSAYDDAAIAFNNSNESFKELGKTLNQFAKKPLEGPEPSKYISKPKNNFKIR